MRFTGLEELLKAEIGEDEKLKILAAQYIERLKEQKLLLDSTRILGDTSLSLEDAIRRVLRDIPDAFQYPEICEASFEYTTVQEKTGKFKKTPWSLSVEMTASDGHPCVLEVVYLEEKPVMDEGPFLKEERALIDALGDIILVAVNRAILMHDINRQAHESRLLQRKEEFIIQNAPVPIFEINQDLSIVKTNSAYSQVTGIPTEKLLKMNLSEITVTKRTGRTAREAIDMKTVLSGELELDVPAGQKVLEYLYLPILDDNGDVLSVINFYVDKTAEKTAVRDIISLTHAAKAGQLDTRVDPDKYEGDLLLLAKGINDTLDAVIGPLNVAADYVDRISKGDIPPKITDSYNGDFNEIKNNLNQCIDAVNYLIADAGLLSRAAVEGKLDTRADATKHQGDFRKIVEGVNATLDAVIGPLNVAAEYVDRISKGDIPPKITDSYNGDFNEIKNNLNQCIDAVNLLISDSNLLAQAAIDGKLDTRADATKHQGDFRKIVEGVNNTLDSVIGPVKEAMRVAERYAKADFSTRVDENLRVAGDFVLFKNSLNNIGIFVQSAIQEIQRISNLYASGNFAAEFDRNLKIEGDLALLRDALNTIGMNVSEVLSVIAREMKQLAHQAEIAGTGIEDVSRGAELIAKNAEQTKQNAERSEDGINQVLQTMEDLTRTISEVSSNAERVAGLSVQANDLAKQGIGAAGKADKGMQSITKTSEEVETIFAEIRAQMHEIVKIVDLITDIANQTNLLSLNAAIEAARAGEAGKGFAVVAAEVKSLAQRSRQSAEHIADMISDLQKKSDAASGAMAEAGTAVAEGSAALSETLGIFNTLTTSVEDITRNMEMVASATEEQAASFEEITASVNEMSLLVKNTAKDALNSSATSEEALAVVDQITNVIGQINEVVKTIGTEMEKFTYKNKS